MAIQYGQVTVAGAVAGAACPKCNMPAGAPCVYLPFNVGPQGPRIATTLTKRYRRIGTPMTTVHPERRAVIRYRRYAAAIRREREAWPLPSGDVTAAARALHVFDMAEYRQLSAWLAEHGHLLVNANVSDEESAS